MKKEFPQKRRLSSQKDIYCSESRRAVERRKQSSTYIKNKAESDRRVKLQFEIEDMVKAGKGKIEILTYLLNKYPDPVTSKYYGVWIDNKFERLNIKNPDFETKER